MSKHSPGPWGYEAYTAVGHEHMGCVWDRHGESVRGLVASDVQEEDGRLIAAAPELLDILNALLEMPTACTADHEVNENAHRRAIARALIARIEGGK